MVNMSRESGERLAPFLTFRSIERENGLCSEGERWSLSKLLLLTV